VTDSKSTPEKPALSPAALELVARRFRVLSLPLRLQLLQELFPGELTVQELCKRTGASQPSVSKHLSLMTQEGLLARRQQGSFAFYEIFDPSVFELCRLVCGSLAERFEEASAEFRSA